MLLSGLEFIGEMGKSGFILLIIAALFVFGTRCIVIVPQASNYVVERLGAYHTTWNTGLHFKLPFLDRISKKVNMKEQVVDFAPQPVITKDNVTMMIDSVVYLIVSDPKLSTYGVENVMSAIGNLTATTLRNIIGDMELDETLTSRDLINGQMRSILDEATDPWGIKITRVELKNIQPPVDIQNAMEKQMRAERERREKILQAEGDKKAAVLIAEGDKTAKILTAEADKEAAILEAEAKKQAAILAAEAQKQAAILAAEGEAEAIIKVKDAEALGIEKIRMAGADDAVIRLRSLSAMEEMAKGQATKIVIPSDLQGQIGTLTALVDSVRK